MQVGPVSIAGRYTYAGDNAALDGKVRSAFAREPGLSANIDIGLTVFMQQALMHLHRPPVNQNGVSDDTPKPSARMTATLRAAHQLLDMPLILDDPLALPILGPTQEAEMRADPGRHSNPVSNVMRATMAVRSRLAEDSWLQAQRQGVRQYVILGAGLDTFAYRTGSHPDAQAGHRSLAGRAGRNRGRYQGRVEHLGQWQIMLVRGDGMQVGADKCRFICR